MMPLKDYKYKQNQTLLKVFGYGDNKKIKVITMNVLRTSGIEDENEIHTAKGTVNNEKLEDNICRAKSKIFELAFCNEWEYFFTGTINPNKYDRTDLDKYYFDFRKWINNQSVKLKSKIDYLFIPELHSDGKSWHLHGFIKGLPKSQLSQFKIGDTMGSKLAEKVANGEVVYNWLSYQDKFGFNDLEPIKNAEAVSKYITKYINKNLASSVTELNAHLYYHSRGLKFAELKKIGFMWSDIKPTFENDFCKVAWLEYSDELLTELANSIETIDYYRSQVL